MKKLPLILTICFLASAAFAGPEPAPWWKNVEDTQSLLMKWVGALTLVGTAVITAAATLYGLLNSKIKEVRERQDRQSEEKNQLQAQVVDLAKQTPPNQNPPTV